MRAKTILVRCVDPRFEGEWRASVLKAIGPHYTLTELGGIDPIGEEGFKVLVGKAERLLSINSGIERLVVLCHEDCAWCKAQKINDEEQLNLAGSLKQKLNSAFPQLEVAMARADIEGRITFF